MVLVSKSVTVRRFPEWLFRAAQCYIPGLWSKGWLFYGLEWVRMNDGNTTLTLTLEEGVPYANRLKGKRKVVRYYTHERMKVLDILRFRWLWFRGKKVEGKV